MTRYVETLAWHGLFIKLINRYLTAANGSNMMFIGERNGYIYLDFTKEGKLNPATAIK